MCNRPVNQGILKNGERENSESVSGSETHFQTQKASMNMKNRVFRRMENAGRDVFDFATL
jgi:hypothetical protein